MKEQKQKIDAALILHRLVDPLLALTLTDIRVGLCCNKYFAAINEINRCETCNTKPKNYLVTDQESLETAIKSL